MSETIVTSAAESPSPHSRRRRRGMGAVIVLTAVLGIAGVAGAHHTGFPDVPSGAYFHEPVGWAAGNGITDGYGETGMFRPELDVTRGEVVTFLHRNHLAFNPTLTLSASVTGTGTLPAGAGAIAADRHNEPAGQYVVTFDRDIGGCWYQATPRTGSPRFATINTLNDTSKIVVNTFNHNGVLADTAFHLAVTCPNAS